MGDETMKEYLPLEPFLSLIRERYGMIFQGERGNDIKEAIRARMAACGVSKAAEYLAYIRLKEDEFLSFIGLLTVNETYFFREPAQLDVLARHLTDRLRHHTDKPVFRLLSAGCSTGEEAYSLAIKLLEIPGAGETWDFSVVGVDVDVNAIEKARNGIFGEYSFRTFPEEKRLHYFDRTTNGHFSIKAAVKEKVAFAVVNLCAPLYPATMERMDVIFFRNVAIYFSKERRCELFNRLSGLLAEGGLMFVSSTEILNYNSGPLKLGKENSTFFYRKQGVVYDELQKATPAPLRRRRLATVPSSQNSNMRSVKVAIASKEMQVKQESMAADYGPNFEGALELAGAKQYNEALAMLEKLIAVEPVCLKAYGLKASILLNQQKTAAVKDICIKALKIDEFFLEAYLLIGMAAKLEGHNDEAVQRFKEAVYLKPDCWLAHFYMAEIFQLRQEVSLARREYEITMNLLGQGNIEKHGLTFFPIAFQAAQFIQLCHYNLKKLNGITA